MAEIKNVTAGIDIGGTNTVFGLVDKNGNILSKDLIPTKGHKSFEEFIYFSASKIKMLLNSKSYNLKLKGIGIGAPNGNIFRGTIEHAANLDWKGILPVAGLLKKEFNLPVKVTNDANAAALGEKLFGNAKHIDNFIEITLGTGLGSGIFAEGKLLYGHSGFAGELGHVIVKENGRQCGCGRKGCLETYVSATGLLSTVKELVSDTEEVSMMRDIDFNTLTSKDVYDFAKNGDVLALKAFDFTAYILGRALADFTAVLSPEKIFLFGGLAEAGDLLLKPAEKYMNEDLLRVYKNTVSIEKSGLKHGEAAILGAAALIWEEIGKG
ncbi:MAG: ROK family protein [Bacteroidetes bacterium]|nr:MAG: ROK family protein [Bacteroidota bacterium]